MPLFHFHLVKFGESEHVGSIELLSRGETLPIGLQLIVKILANTVSENDVQEGVVLQATDDTGAVVYNFDIIRRAKRNHRPNGYLH